MKYAPLALILLILAAITQPITTAEAARGVPGSFQFGFGGCIYPDGPFLNEALHLSQSLNLDWVQIDVAWDTIWPDPSLPANWSNIDQVMIFFNNKPTFLMLSIVDAPLWVMTDTGPDSTLANIFIEHLFTRYPNVIDAIEIFPSANTLAGWRANPNPENYLNLFLNLKNKIHQIDPSVLVIAGGLSPTSNDPQSGAIDDLQYLQGLYDAGGRDHMPIISLDFSTLVNNPDTPPSTTEPRLLRHYEQVRMLMHTNNHDSGLLWINHLRLPDNYSDTAAAEWITNAYSQLRSQLYIGVVFYDSINQQDPQREPTNPNALLLTDGQNHSHYHIFNNMILQNSNGSLTSPPGRPKAEPLNKGDK